MGENKSFPPQATFYIICTYPQKQSGGLFLNLNLHFFNSLKGAETQPLYYINQSVSDLVPANKNAQRIVSGKQHDNDLANNDPVKDNARHS